MATGIFVIHLTCLSVIKGCWYGQVQNNSVFIVSLCFVSDQISVWHLTANYCKAGPNRTEVSVLWPSSFRKQVRLHSINGIVPFWIPGIPHASPLSSCPLLPAPCSLRLPEIKCVMCWKEKQNRNGGRKEQRIKCGCKDFTRCPKKCFELLNLNVNDNVVVETCLNQDTWYVVMDSRCVYAML